MIMFDQSFLAIHHQAEDVFRSIPNELQLFGRKLATQF